LAGDGEALRLRGNEEERAPMGTRVELRLREERDEVGARAVRDERLLPIQHPVATVATRDRADARDVTARTRFRDAERGDLFSAEGGDEELLDLLLRTEVADHRRRHVALDEER